MSILKTNQITDLGGNELLTSNGSGVISSGGAITNTPAFHATISSNQTLSDATKTTVNFDTEVLDTNSCYDTSSYKFTPNVAGKYYIYASVRLLGGGNSQIQTDNIYILKNGSNQLQLPNNYNDNEHNGNVRYVSNIIDMNGSSDYVQIAVQVDSVSATPSIETGGNPNQFYGYKIIGA